MKAKTLFTATALLALSLAPALQAQYDRYPDRDRYSDRYSDRYQGRYPDYGHMDRVSALAHEIDQTARYIYREAARNNRYPDRNEARMLQGLYQLYGRADRFHDQVESYRRDPRRTDAEFVALEQSFNRLGNALRYVEPRSYVDRGMQRIYDLMSDLSRYYGRSGYGRWGRYGQDRYGYDRDDRYDRYDRDGYDDRYDRRPRN